MWIGLRVSAHLSCASRCDRPSPPSSASMLVPHQLCMHVAAASAVLRCVLVAAKCEHASESAWGGSAAMVANRRCLVDGRQHGLAHCRLPPLSHEPPPGRHSRRGHRQQLASSARRSMRPRRRARCGGGRRRRCWPLPAALAPQFQSPASCRCAFLASPRLQAGVDGVPHRAHALKLTQLLGGATPAEGACRGVLWMRQGAWGGRPPSECGHLSGGWRR